jgi:hypothetical protein
MLLHRLCEGRIAVFVSVCDDDGFERVCSGMSLTQAACDLQKVDAMSAVKSSLIVTACTIAYIDYGRQLAATMESGLLPTLMAAVKWTLPLDALTHSQQYNWKIQRTVDLLKQAKELGLRLQPFADEPHSLEECEAAIDYKVMVCSTKTLSSVKQ